MSPTTTATLPWPPRSCSAHTRRGWRARPCSGGSRATGASNHIHTTRILPLSDDLPIVVIIVDTDERIRAFLPELDVLITAGLVIIDDVEVVKYVGPAVSPLAWTGFAAAAALSAPARYLVDG